MDRRITLIIGIAALLVILSAIYLTLHQNLLLVGGGPVGVAFGDPDIRREALNHPGQYSIGDIKPLGQDGMAGYIGLNDTVMLVPISIGSDPIDHESYNAYVDLNTSTVVGKEFYTRMRMPNDMNITIPPGAAWFYCIRGESRFGGMAVKPNIEVIEPDNSDAYAFIADDWGLKNFYTIPIDSSARVKNAYAIQSPFVELVNANNSTGDNRYFIVYNANRSGDIQISANFFWAV